MKVGKLRHARNSPGLRNCTDFHGLKYKFNRLDTNFTDFHGLKYKFNRLDTD